MVYIYSVLVAALLSSGQALWKSAAMTLSASTGFSIQKLFWEVFLTPKFIVGGVIYVFATVLYVWLFTKFPFYQVQLTMMAASITLTLVISTLVFKDSLSVINFIGVSIILFGIFLVNYSR